MRTPLPKARVKNEAQAIAELISDRLAVVKGSRNPHQQYWYALKAIRLIIDQAESEYLDGLKYAGAWVPEKFDFSIADKKVVKKGKKK